MANVEQSFYSDKAYLAENLLQKNFPYPDPRTIFALTPEEEVHALLEKTPEDVTEKIIRQRSILQQVQARPSILRDQPYLFSSQLDRNLNKLVSANRFFQKAFDVSIGHIRRDKWESTSVATLSERIQQHLSPFACFFDPEAPQEAYYEFANILSAIRFELLTAPVNKVIDELSSHLLASFLPSFLPQKNIPVILTPHGEGDGSYGYTDSLFKKPIIFLEAGIPDRLLEMVDIMTHFGPEHLLTLQNRVNYTSVAVHEKIHASCAEQMKGFHENYSYPYSRLRKDILEGIAMVGELHVLACWKDSVGKHKPLLASFIEERQRGIMSIFRKIRRLDKADRRSISQDIPTKEELISREKERRITSTINHVTYVLSLAQESMRPDLVDYLRENASLSFENSDYLQPYTIGSFDFVKGLIRQFGFDRVYGLDGQTSLISQINLKKYGGLRRYTPEYARFLEKPELLLS